MSKNKIFLFALAAICIVGVVSIYTASHNRDAASLKIGIISPLTGQYAKFGENLVKGAQLAIDEYNTQNNTHVLVVVEDDGFEEKKGLSAYHKLMSLDTVDALVVGSSATINAIYTDVSKLDIPVVTYGAQSIEETDDNVFHVYPSSVPVIQVMAEYISQTAPTSTVSALVTNDIITTKFLDVFKKELKNNLTSIHLIDKDTHDSRTDVLKVMSEKPDYIFMSNLVDVGTVAVKNILLFRKDNTRPRILFDQTFNEVFSDYQKVLGSNMKLLNGSIVVSVKKGDPSIFAAKYKATYGGEPGPLADYGYDAMMLLLKNHSTDHHTWISKISKSNYVGMSGLIKFDDVGRRIPEFRITEIKDGRIPEF